MNRYTLLLVLLGAICSLIVTACTKQDSVGTEESINLYIEGVDRTRFMQEYGIDFEIQHPGVKIMVLDDEYGGNHKPDLIALNGFDDYKQKVSEGSLTPLDSYLNRDRKELEVYLESPKTIRGLEILQSYTPETLYALPMSLSSGALFYNKDLFDRYEVPYPWDYITWDEIIELAQRFPTQMDEGKPLYGLSYTSLSGPFSYIIEVAYLQDLPYFDPGNWTITMNTPEWRAIWEKFLPGMRGGHFQMDPTAPTSYYDHPFFLGQAAMLRETSYFITMMEKLVKTRETINWDIVTVPILSRSHPKSPYYSLGEAYGIASDSPNKDMVWELIAFIIRSNSPSTESDGRDLTPFYALEYEYRPQWDREIFKLIYELQQMASEQLVAVVQEEKTLEEALRQLELDGQQRLNEYRALMKAASDETDAE